MNLVPQPRQLETASGFHRWTRGLPVRVLDLAREPEAHGVTATIDPADLGHDQGYRLTILPDAIRLVAHDPAGRYYGLATLLQIVREAWVDVAGDSLDLPCLTIHDWPDFPARGVMLDISRDKVPTMDTLYALVDQLSEWKINQFQLYTEHTFAYQQHEDVWRHASPMTAEEIRELDAFCQTRFIELVPNQNSFGHMHRWLKYPRYAPLAELHGYTVQNWWGTGPFSVCPLDPGSIALFEGLYNELLPNFSSGMFNVGCDETFDLGQGRSQAECKRVGVGRVYLDYLLKIHRAVSGHGRQMQFWGEIILQHPELVAELPGDIIPLAWGYEADHPFDEQAGLFARTGHEFYVCPGTSSWCSLAGRTTNALGNLRNAAIHGLKHGAKGFLNTDWGDRGHWQPRPVSDLGYAYGAAVSWAVEANLDLDIVAALSVHAYADRDGASGQVAYALGEVYRSVGTEPPNGSALFWAMHSPPGVFREQFATLTGADLERAEAAIAQAAAGIDSIRSQRTDAALLGREWHLAAELLRHGVRHARVALGAADVETITHARPALTAEFESIWLARNRPGGLQDSLARFHGLGSYYEADTTL